MPTVMDEVEQLPSEAEEKLRLRAFHAFYRAFDGEPDLTLRFGKAIVASAGPIRDREALTEWYRQHGDCSDIAVV